MIKPAQQSGWLKGALILMSPVILVFALGMQMALSQGKARFEYYKTVPEVSSLTELNALPAESSVRLRGQISEATPLRKNDPDAAGLIVFQERPADREVRYREAFPLIFPEIIVDLSDGAVDVMPSVDKELIIQGELHSVPVGERVLTGFRIGDTVTVQGTWQPGEAPILTDATGISSIDRATLFAEWEKALSLVAWVRNGLALLTLLGIIFIVLQVRQNKKQPPTLPNKDDDECQPQNQKIIPTT